MKSRVEAELDHRLVALNAVQHETAVEGRVGSNRAGLSGHQLAGVPASSEDGGLA